MRLRPFWTEDIRQQLIIDFSSIQSVQGPMEWSQRVFLTRSQPCARETEEDSASLAGKGPHRKLWYTLSYDKAATKQSHF